MRIRVLAVVVLALFATATAAPPATAYRTDEKTVKRQIRRAWKGNDRRAIRVARCESSLNPKAISPSGTYRGLWQFSLTTWREYDPPKNDPIRVNARQQTRIAWKLWKDRRWKPWPTCGAKKTARRAGLSGPTLTELRR